jgi:hypothetical protein
MKSGVQKTQNRSAENYNFGLAGRKGPVGSILALLDLAVHARAVCLGATLSQDILEKQQRKAAAIEP